MADRELIALAEAMALALTERPADATTKPRWAEAARPILAQLHAQGWTIQPGQQQEAFAHG